MTVDFNALVLEMRRVRTDEAIAALYEQLFRLEEWFLPNDPNEPLGSPMQWQFPNGLDKTPCILVYTDVDHAKRRADEVAAPLGKTGEVMAIEVANAVAWMLSGELGVSWASINHGAGLENFPLHFDQIENHASAAGLGQREFFPATYKQFAFQEGDLLASQRSDGKYAINKILKIDKVTLKPGESISIQGQQFTAPIEDFLLIVSAAYGASEFDSLDQAREAAAANKWTTKVAHVPNRPPGAAAGQTRIGSAPVTEAELAGYKIWRAAFDKGEAGVF